MLNQSPTAILMIRPSYFEYNKETAGSNAFQTAPTLDTSTIRKNALIEFNGMVDILESHGISVELFDEEESTSTPDAIFPNNWFSTHHDGKIFIYPMEAENRRRERRKDIIEYLMKKYTYKELYDYSSFENSGQYLEGTGSIVFDHLAQKAYACISTRMDKSLLDRLCDNINYKPICFHAHDSLGIPIYHTNVMMCLTTQLAIICLDSIEANERMRVVNHLKLDNKKIIELSMNQMTQFAGNMLEVQNDEGVKFLVMSESAYQSLEGEQVDAIRKHLEIIRIQIPTIEQCGGGSVRCMMAGIH